MGGDGGWTFERVFMLFYRFVHSLRVLQDRCDVRDVRERGCRLRNLPLPSPQAVCFDCVRRGVRAAVS